MKFYIEQLKKLLLISIFALAGFAVLANCASAAINPLIKFEGKVTNTNGTELADNTYDFTFSLYNQASGGSAIWTETLDATTRFRATTTSGTVVNASSTTFYFATSTAMATSTLRAGQYLTNSTQGESALIIDFNSSAGTIEVVGTSFAWSDGDLVNNRAYVEGGIIDQNLGTVTDLTSVDFNQPLYLEVVFNGEMMQPRKLIAATAHAFESAKLGGKSESEFATLDDDETITGEWSFENVLSIATSSNSAVLTVTQNGTGNLVEFMRGLNTAFAIDNNGYVQIADYILPNTYVGSSPGYVLKTDASGNMYWSPDLVGFGGSGFWASSTNNLFIYPVDTSYPVVIGNNATTSPYNIKFEVNGFSWFDNIGVSNSQELRFFDSDSSNYFAFKATSTLSTDYILTLPDGYGTPGETLLIDANHNLYWGSPSSYTYVNSGLAGQIPYFASDGDVLTGTSSIFISANGNIAIGTTTASTTLTIGSSLGSQFLVNNIGEIVEGVWRGSPVGVAYGGTGTTTFNALSLPFLSDPNTFGEITIGSANYILSVNDSGTGYEWVEASSTGAYRSDEDIQDLVGAMVGAVTRIAINYDDPSGQITYTVDSDLSNYDNSTSQFYSTTTLGALPVNWGGTGRTSNFSQYSLLFASTTSLVGEITTAGQIGKILQVDSDGVPFWAATNTLGIDFSAVGGTLLTDQGGTGQDTSGWNGMVQVVGGTWQEVTGVENAIAFWSDAYTVEATTTIYLGTNGYVGIGTSSPSGLLTVGQNSGNQFIVNSAGEVVGGYWMAGVIGLAYGGTGATTATSARENLGLADVYKFGINATGTNGEVWISDGDGRGQWVATSTLGIGGGGYAIFTGTTTATTDGSIASSSLVGYAAANLMCDFEYPGSHFCHTYEMITSIDKGDITNWGNDTTSAWVAEGPPGYTTNANDCNGWTNNTSSDTYGAFWLFNSNGGGAAWLVNCSVSRPLTCCSWQ